MPIRNTTHVLKNSDIVNRPLPSNILKGEAIVNTADGIMFFSGVTLSTSGWTQSGPSTPTFWEVGSNLYDLKIRNQIKSYSGLTNLSGMFLSGTTNGFVLAPISSIVGIDTYVTAFTYSNNVATIRQNLGQPDLSVLINTMTGLTVNGSLSATTSNLGNANINILNTSAGTITTLTSTTANINAITATSITGTNVTATNVSINGRIQSYSGNTNLSGQFLSGTTNGFVLASISAITSVDTFTTGFTYTPSSNLLTIRRNLNQPDLTATINSVSGLTVSNLNAGRVVYVGTSGLLTDEAGFTYNSTTNTLSIPSDGSMNVGSGGLNVDGNVVVQGSLTIFGPSISAFTSQLYVEDSNISINYNPTGSTISSSIGAGFTIQDGNGIVSGDVNLDIRRMDSLTGLTASNVPNISEYTASTGYSNRGWVTQLNDIVIRSTNISTPNGVRVLTEFDVLSGGEY